MASIFTFDTASRVSSPWSAAGATTSLAHDAASIHHSSLNGRTVRSEPPSMMLRDLGMAKLEPEPQEGPVEYKLHLLLRPRRRFTSMSTSMQYSNDHQGRSWTPANGPQMPGSGLPKPHLVPSAQTRQARLQQLTTQLLWRLQQSSPLHSSSARKLVLPLLPEATPCLGVPERPGMLLPGLEESQGALYEIGVADDGTLVGLTEEELCESLNNLQAMAASLGCVLEVQRRVAVGNCEWTDKDSTGKGMKAFEEPLWVAEALVHPDLITTGEKGSGNKSSDRSTSILGPSNAEDPLPENSCREQLRVALVGSSTSGKSSLLGTLTTSVLDNGRGKSRLSLLKHRHEIASGVTSSVAQELLGYEALHKPRETVRVVNYKSSDISSWSDVHNAATRLCFLCDSPGQLRYSKSTLRTLISWSPHWTLLCVAAGEALQITSDSSNPATPATRSEPLDFSSFRQTASFQHLRLCLKLGVPLVIAVTKLDIATRAGLRSTVAQLLSILKDAGRRPVLLATTAHTDAAQPAKPNLESVDFDDIQEAARAIEAGGEDPESLVPIVLTSSVSGVGLGHLHALLRQLPFVEMKSKLRNVADCSVSFEHGIAFHVDEIFAIPPSKVYSSPQVGSARPGIVLCGLMQEGSVSLGDEMMLGPFVVEPASARRRDHSSGPNSSSLPPTDGHHAISWPLSAGISPLRTDSPIQAGSFARVRVVSLRNLRLPVRSLLRGQVGTIGVVPLDNAEEIIRARKGMILTATMMGSAAYRSFSAIFWATDFMSSTSPAMILGGHAIVYVNSVRAAVKLRSIGFPEDQAGEPVSPQDGNVFDFDSDHGGEEFQADRLVGHEWETVKITFQFVSSVEWLRAGEKVLVVPTTSTTGPVAGPVAPSLGLDGFVGVICELST